MAAPANARSKPADPVAVIWARAEARMCLIADGGEIEDPVAYWMDLVLDVAQQVRRGILDLHNGVDALQYVAANSGLLEEHGQDFIQRLLSEAFAPARGMAVAA